MGITLENFDLDKFAEILFDSFKARAMATKEVVNKETGETDVLTAMELVCPVIFLDKEFKDLTEYERLAMVNGSVNIITATLDTLQELQEKKNVIKIVNSLPSELSSININDRRRIK